MKWSVGFKIGCMNAIAVIALICISIVNYYSTNRMVEAIDWRQNSYEIMDHLGLLQAALVDAETGQRGYLIANQERYLEPYHAAIPVISKEFATLKNLTADNDSQQRRLESLTPLIKSKLDNIEKSLTVTDTTQKLALLDDGKHIMDTIRVAVQDMRTDETDLLKEQIVESTDRINMLFYVIVDGTIAGVIFIMLMGVMLTRNISKPLQAMVDAAKLLSQSVSEIFTAVSQLVSSGSETATAVNETTSTIEEVKQTSHIANQKAKSVSDNAQQVTQISLTGKKSIQETNENTMRIQSKMGSIADSMMRLSEQTQVISSIIEAVDDLAQQSNLLAVNASIEAEKAGEHGRGFRVVAQEIKSLADQSKQATHRVREILSDVQKATNTAVLATEEGNKVVETGVKKSEETGESISVLSNSIAESAQAAIQIAASCQQQLVGIEQAALAMENIKQASLQNVEISRQLEASATALKEMGSKLEKMIDTYKI